jgi:hypothetical protein
MMTFKAINARRDETSPMPCRTFAHPGSVVDDEGSDIFFVGHGNF